MSVRNLRARLERLEAKLFKRSRMAELIAKFKTGDLTAEEDKEALWLDRRWSARAERGPARRRPRGDDRGGGTD
jgi:hypothetical protein